jgi:hypothetical protein
MDAWVLIIAAIVIIFAIDLVRQWWRQTEWKRRWRDRE